MSRKGEGNYQMLFLRKTGRESDTSLSRIAKGKKERYPC
jgi:hypothetical protein